MEICAVIRDRDDEFAREKRALARVYLDQVLPETLSLHQQVINGAEAVTGADLLV